MNKTWHIIKRELASYFGSPIAYVFLIIFLILTGFFTFMMGGFSTDELITFNFRKTRPLTGVHRYRHFAQPRGNRD